MTDQTFNMPARQKLSSLLPVTDKHLIQCYCLPLTAAHNNTTNSPTHFNETTQFIYTLIHMLLQSRNAVLLAVDELGYTISYGESVKVISCIFCITSWHRVRSLKIGRQP